MGYRAGIGLGFATQLGMPERPREPHIYCDGCGLTHPVSSRTLWAATWFMKGKPPPKWTGRRDGDRRLDYCPACKEVR